MWIVGVGLVRSVQPWDILLIDCNNQFKKYTIPLLRLVRWELSTPLLIDIYVYVRSFLCPFVYFNKTLLQKTLEWSSLAPGPDAKIFLFGDHESDIIHCKLSELRTSRCLSWI